MPAAYTEARALSARSIARRPAHLRRNGKLMLKVGLANLGKFAPRTARATHEPTEPWIPVTRTPVTLPVAPVTVTATVAVGDSSVWPSAQAFTSDSTPFIAALTSSRDGVSD